MWSVCIHSQPEVLRVIQYILDCNVGYVICLYSFTAWSPQSNTVYFRLQCRSMWSVCIHSQPEVLRVIQYILDCNVGLCEVFIYVIYFRFIQSNTVYFRLQCRLCDLFVFIQAWSPQSNTVYFRLQCRSMWSVCIHSQPEVLRVIQYILDCNVGLCDLLVFIHSQNECIF